MHRRILLSALTATAVTLAAPAPPAAADTYRVTLDPSVRREPADGRLILFFVTETGGRWDHIAPETGPFWERPQPIASVAVSGLEPGGFVTIDGTAIAFPTSLDSLDGPVRVQAILDVDNTERSHLEGPNAARPISTWPTRRYQSAEHWRTLRRSDTDLPGPSPWPL